MWLKIVCHITREMTSSFICSFSLGSGGRTGLNRKSLSSWSLPWFSRVKQDSSESSVPFGTNKNNARNWGRHCLRWSGVGGQLRAAFAVQSRGGARLLRTRKKAGVTYRCWA
jgi:hypothetical protein